MAFHRFKIVEDDVTHWEGDQLVLSYMDSARLLVKWMNIPGGDNSTEGYEAWLREELKGAPKR